LRSQLGPGEDRWLGAGDVNKAPAVSKRTASLQWLSVFHSSMMSVQHARGSHSSWANLTCE